MQDQPRYEVYEPSQSFEDGQSSRPPVEGTVPRGAQFRESDAYLYTGRQEAGAGGRGQAGDSSGRAVDANAPEATQTGGVGTAGANLSTVTGGGAQPTTGDVNVRGNVSGGIPGAVSATGGPDVFPFAVTMEDLNRGQERFNAYCSMCHGLTGEGDGMIVRRGFRKPPSFHSEQLQEGTASASHFFDVVTNGWGAMPSYSDMISPEDRWKIIAYVRALQMSRKGKIEDVPADRRGKLSTSGGGGQQQHQTGGQTSGEPNGGGRGH